jgi:UDP-glucose 6-dehydrogenase
VKLLLHLEIPLIIEFSLKRVSIKNDFNLLFIGTVPVGTNKKIHEILSKFNQNPDECFTIVSQPEFLAEGTAIHNLVNPDRVIIGTPTNLNGRETYELLGNFYKN